ncbi:Enkurin [Trichoplax sp. H2]|nr:Enkurin [Trichoplax sp. H2]|eukprot:RDD36730.1 Enkurin [Trichoplax sp. H2]
MVDCGESIYNLIPKVEEISIKEKRYVSKFSGTVRDDVKKVKSPAKTMGPLKAKTTPPKDFLKKHSGEIKLPNKKQFNYPDSDKRRPAVPKKNEKPLMGLQSKKNFITTNAVENIMKPSRKVEPAYVDSEKGTRHILETSGLVPKYVYKKDFGKTPTYLQKRKEEIDRNQKEYDEYIQQRIEAGKLHQISDSEREEMLSGLRANWDELHRQYQGLSVVIDTLPKKQKKENLEKEMQQLEKDIEVLEKHNVIYVA